MKRLHLVFLAFFISSTIFSQGNVYLVIGSDTAIWDAMDVAKYNCTYSTLTIPDKSKNYYEVMQKSYRDKFSDSFGGKLKLTWWLMCGNIFRYATNKNVPYANLIVPYQSKKYYGDGFNLFGDELTLHYHTFAWTDYDNDGKYYWNQAKDFSECKADFYYTLAQLLVEENIFPVSFRSGWNTMDNSWQAELDKLIPYSMHNEAPAYRSDTTEPIDNNYDWRMASQEFVPYRPASQNYQVAGHGKGWNLHSKYVGNVNQKIMNDIFSKAKTKDQVVCLWGHVWDELFPEYLLRIDTLAKNSSLLNPGVKFKYCTAVEGMQLWRNNKELNSPSINFNEINSGDKLKFRVDVDKHLFQQTPFLAIKLIDESYTVAKLLPQGNNSWISELEFDKANIAKIAIAATDTLGNLSTKSISYLPEDIYVDNSSTDYIEMNGNWLTDNASSWGLDSRKSTLQNGDSSKVRWRFKIATPQFYNVFVQSPKLGSSCSYITFRILSNNKIVNSINITSGIPGGNWFYLSTVNFESSENNFVEMIAYGVDQANKILAADVIKISPLIRKKWLYVNNNKIDLGYVIKSDTIKTAINLYNQGTENLTINKIISKNNLLLVNHTLPIVIPKFSSIQLPVKFLSSEIGIKVDTLFIHSDDIFNPMLSLSCQASVQNYFKIVDNEESVFYNEYGMWSKSNAQAYGASSRYANLNQSPRAYSVFYTKVKENGYYNISFIIPKTENATNKALYVVQQDNRFADSIYINQNLNSGNWIKLSNRFLVNDLDVKIKVVDDGKSTSGTVIRTDAIKLDFTGDVSDVDKDNTLPSEFKLYQNYPNPFNPTTVIRYQISKHGNVSIKIYDLLGRLIKTIVNEPQQAGFYEYEFRVEKGDLPSGIYFYTLSAHNFTETKKMVFLK